VSTVVALREPGGETRAALTPEAARSITALGHRVVVQTGVGARASYPDQQYAAAGAAVLEGPPLAEALREADLLVHVVPLPAERVTALRPGTITLGLAGATDGDRRAALADAGLVPLAFEQLPRSSRAQTMDVLSSQALAAGYRAVLEAAIRLPRFFPLAMTAAGTVPPAKVVVLGVGVAGLQAIATARRLGASVWRPTTSGPTPPRRCVRSVAPSSTPASAPPRLRAVTPARSPPPSRRSSSRRSRRTSPRPTC